MKSHPPFMYINSKESLQVNEKNIYRIEEKQTTIIMEDFIMPHLMMNRKTDQRGERQRGTLLYVN